MQKFRSHTRQTLQMSIPIIIGQLGQMMMGVVDSIMVGTLGPAPLAAAAIGNGFYMLVLVFGFGMSMALSPLVAESYGQGQYERCGHILRQSLLINTILGLILTLLTYHGAHVIGFLNQQAEVEILAIRYSEILALSTYPLLVFQTYRQFTEGLSFTKPAMFIALFANIVNIFFNWIFIYGNLGAPAMGLEGAGWATLCSRIFMGAMMIAYALLSKRIKPFHPGMIPRRINSELITNLFKIGLGSAFQYFFEIAAFVGAAFMVGWLGTNELAAHQIAINLASITFMCALGVSMASAIRVGNAKGRGSVEDMKLAGFSSLALIAMIMAVNGAIFVMLNNVLPTFYISNPEVISIASQLLLIAALFQLSDGIQAVAIGALRGLADARMPTLITFFSYWIVGLPVGYFLAFQYNLNVYGIWIGLLTGLTVSAVMLTFRFRHLTRPTDSGSIHE